MWFYFALFSAIVYSFRSIVEKISLRNINKYILAFGLRIFALPLFIIPFAINPSLMIPINSIPLVSWLAIFFVTFISTPFEMIFFYKALEIAEVSSLVPLLSLAPIITTLFNLIIFKSIPTILGFLGTFILVFSVYLLNITKAKEGLLKPFHHLSKDKAIRYLTVMMVFYALGVVVDKLAISGTNPYYYGLINYILVSIALFFIAKYKSPQYFYQLRKNFITFIILGIIVFLYTIPRFISLSLGNAGYVAAILSSNVIISTIIGLVFLKENNALIKISASIMAFVGLVILKLYS